MQVTTAYGDGESSSRKGSSLRETAEMARLSVNTIHVSEMVMCHPPIFAEMRLPLHPIRCT